jgi:hypothetical protein
VLDKIRSSSPAKRFNSPPSYRYEYVDVCVGLQQDHARGPRTKQCLSFVDSPADRALAQSSLRFRTVPAYWEVSGGRYRDLDKSY